MITPRGYQRKYTLGAETQPLKPHQRLKSEAEPWALEQLDEQDWDESMEEFDEEDELLEGEVTEIKEPFQLKSSPNLSLSPLQLAMEALQLVSKRNEEVSFEFATIS